VRGIHLDMKFPCGSNFVLYCFLNWISSKQLPALSRIKPKATPGAIHRAHRDLGALRLQLFGCGLDIRHLKSHLLEA